MNHADDDIHTCAYHLGAPLRAYRSCPHTWAHRVGAPLVLSSVFGSGRTARAHRLIVLATPRRRTLACILHAFATMGTGAPLGRTVLCRPEGRLRQVDDLHGMLSFACFEKSIDLLPLAPVQMLPLQICNASLRQLCWQWSRWSGADGTANVAARYRFWIRMCCLRGLRCDGALKRHL